MDIIDVQQLATSLMKKHELTGWKFQLDNGVVRFGYCNQSNRVISISKHLAQLNSEERVKDTILHEIAHAIAGHRAGHGRTWQSIAINIGCNGERLYKSSEVKQPPKKWLGTCDTCKTTIYQHRTTKNLACSGCCKKYNNGKWSIDYIFIWSKNEGGNVEKVPPLDKKYAIVDKQNVNVVVEKFDTIEEVRGYLINFLSIGYYGNEPLNRMTIQELCNYGEFRLVE